VRGAVLVPSVCAGLLLALSLPPWGWWPLAFCGAALLYRRLRGLRLRTRVLAGWAAGLGCFVPGLWWAASFNWYGAVVLMAVEALSTAVAAALVPADRWRVPAFAGAFTLLEAVRLSWPFGGLPLGGVFLGQATGPLLPAARLGGPLLLTAVVWLGGAGLAELVDGVRARRPLVAAAGALAVALVAAAGAVGAVAPDGGPAVRTLVVAAVQGGGRRGVLESEVDPATVFAAQVAATGSLLRAERQRVPAHARPGDGRRQARPALVVWPEDVVAVGPRLTGTPQAAVVATLARQLDATLVAGVTETLSATAFRNEAVVWAPNGRVVGTYEKVHRVPFGEYVPDRALFSHLAGLSAVPRDAVPGHGTGSLRTPAARIGLMVSYEVFFASRARSSVRAGAELLVVPTNTSSYASSQVPTLEIAADRMQAVSEGRDLVQAAPTGYSTVVTHLGTVVRRSSLGARGVVTATVGLRTGRTLYEELGDLPVLVAAAAALALPVARRAQAEARRRRRHG
jgi:apolipoprotein N-acyltransferase